MSHDCTQAKETAWFSLVILTRVISSEQALSTNDKKWHKKVQKKAGKSQKIGDFARRAILEVPLRMVAGLYDRFLGYWRDPGADSQVEVDPRWQSLQILLTASTYVLYKYPKIPNNGVCIYWFWRRVVLFLGQKSPYVFLRPNVLDISSPVHKASLPRCETFDTSSHSEFHKRITAAQYAAPALLFFPI